MLTCPTFRREIQASYLYCYGNSLPEDAFLYHESLADRDSSLSALFLGCGDIRNLLFTLAEAYRKDAKATLEFTLNDWAPEVLARNALMLFALDADPSLNRSYLMQLFYSLEISDEAHAYWTNKIQECIDFDWQAKQHSFLRFEDEKTLAALRNVWSRWLAFNWSKSQLKKKRREFLMKQPKFKSGGSIESIFKEMTDYFVNHYLGAGISSAHASLSKECLGVLLSGSLEDGGSRVNPTLHLLLPDGSFAYALHYGANPFEGHPINIALGLRKSVQLNLGLWIQAFHKMKDRLGSVKLRLGHVLNVLDDLIVDKCEFDVIETSNLADHVGHLNLLVNCSVLLKDSAASHMKTCSFLSYNFANNTDEYLQVVTGLPKASYPTILGLELADSDTWESKVQPFCISAIRFILTAGRNYEFFIWKKAPRPVLPVSLDDSPFILSSLIQSAETTCVSVLHRQDGPGSANVTPAIFSKMLAFAFAQQRLTVGCAGGSGGSIDNKRARSADILPSVDSLWKQLLDSDLLKGTLSELLMYANLYGFPSAIPEVYMSPFYLQATFPTPRHPSTPTPIVSVNIQTGPVSHTIDSIDLTELPNGRVQISFYAPGFIEEWDPREVHMQLLTGVPTNFGQLVVPFGSPVPFSSMEVLKVKSHDLTDITAGAALVQPGVDTAPTAAVNPLAVVAHVIHPMESDYEVKLNFVGDPAGAKISALENGPNGSFTGLLVNSDFIPIILPDSCVKLISCKIHRKSGFILLVLRRAPISPPAPRLSLKRLPTISDEKSRLEGLGVMFHGEFFEVKTGKKPMSTLCTVDQILCRLKDRIQIMFRDCGNAPFTFLRTEKLGIIGCVFYHGCFFYPPVNSSYSRTPMIDASYAFFTDGSSNTELIKSLFNSGGSFAVNLTLTDGEVEPMKKLFAIFSSQTWDNSSHASIVSLNAQNIFKRCVIHPLFARSVPPLLDSNKKGRDELNSARKKRMDILAQIKKGDLSSLFKMTQKLDIDPEKLLASLQQK